MLYMKQWKCDMNAFLQASGLDILWDWGERIADGGRIKSVAGGAGAG